MDRSEQLTGMFVYHFNSGDQDNLQVIVAAAVGLLLIGFSQSAGDAREFAARHKYRVDIN